VQHRGRRAGVDLTEDGDHPSRVENAEGFLTADDMRWFGGHYLSGGGARRTDPRASVLLAPRTVRAARAAVG